MHVQTEAGHKSSEKTHIVSAAEADKEAAAKKTTEDEYKAKLAENRRLAREKAERESAEEKARAEERRYAVETLPARLANLCMSCALKSTLSYGPSQKVSGLGQVDPGQYL